VYIMRASFIIRMFHKSHKGKDIDSVYEIQASVIVALKLGSIEVTRNVFFKTEFIFIYGYLVPAT
jgi:hypothetical protein